jgi:endonuclease/exonuclease/phosphatase family metal-dependent hydrolase
MSHETPCELPARTGLSVMTYNLGNGLAHAERLVSMLRAVGADLVGLQELAVGQADALGRDLAGMYPYQVLVPTGFSGKGLLSRYPLLQHEQLGLYPGRHDLQATVSIDGVVLEVLVAHPPPPRLSVRAFGFGLEPQALAQIEALGKLALRHAPAVVLGDFNMTPRHPAHARLRDSACGPSRVSTTSGVRHSSVPRPPGSAPMPAPITYP